MLITLRGCGHKPAELLVSDAVQLRQINWPSTDNSHGQANQIVCKAHISAVLSDGQAARVLKLQAESQTES